MRYQGCHCYNCKRDFHHLGIARHRAMHRDRREDCEIMFSDGRTIVHRYSRLPTQSQSTTEEDLA